MSEINKSQENDSKGDDNGAKEPLIVTRVIVSTPEADGKKASMIAKAQKMIEAKEIKVLDARKEAIADGSINEIDLKMLLTKDDQEFYQEKKAQYLAAYPDLGSDPFDMDDLHLMIMEQIMQRTMLRRKKTRPTIDISKEYAESVKRQSEAKRSLSMRRTDRVKEKGSKKQTLNIANLSVQFSDVDKGKIMLDRINKMRLEETVLDDPEKVTE